MKLIARKKNNRFFFILIILFFSNCSLHKYSRDERIEDNTILIKSNASMITINDVNSTQNISPFEKSQNFGDEIKMPFYSKVNNKIKYSFESSNNNQNKLIYSYNYKMSSMNKSKFHLTISSENRESKDLIITRKIRKKALIKDILCLGIPLIIDPFLSTFYEVSDTSKISKIELNYTDAYMKEVYNKIYKSNSFDTFNLYIYNFPHSPMLNDAIFKRDSLLLIEIIKDKNVGILNEFIQSIKLSPFEKYAMHVYTREIASSKYLDSIGGNKTIANLEEYIRRFKGTFNYDKVIEDLLTVGEKETYSKNQIKALLYYKLNIYDKYKDEVYFNFDKPGPIRNQEANLVRDRISVHLGELVKKETHVNSKLSELDNIKNSWLKYMKFCDSMVIDAKGDFTVSDIFQNLPNVNENVFSKLCDILFIRMQKMNESAEAQNKFIEETMREIPFFNHWITNMENINNNDLISKILISAPNKNGKIKLYNSSNFPVIYRKYAELKNCAKNIYNLNWSDVDYENDVIKFDTFDFLILNFKDGKLNGSQEYYYKNQKFYDVEFLDGYNIKKQNYYVKNELITSKIYHFNNYIPKETDLCNANNVSQRNCVYYFRNGKNLTLEALDAKINIGISYYENGEFGRAMNFFEFLNKNNYPIDCEQNLKITKYWNLAIEKQNEILESITNGKYDEEIKAIGQLAINYAISGYSGEKTTKLIKEQKILLSNKIGHKFSKAEDEYFYQKINSQINAYTTYMKFLGQISNSPNESEVSSKEKSGSNGSNICRKCNGNGNVNCSYCNGTTEISCSSCYGSGYSNYFRATCTMCNGRGRKNCHHCGSTNKGREKCSACNGSGYSNR